MKNLPTPDLNFANSPGRNKQVSQSENLLNRFHKVKTCLITHPGVISRFHKVKTCLKIQWAASSGAQLSLIHISEPTRPY